MRIENIHLIHVCHGLYLSQFVLFKIIHSKINEQVKSLNSQLSLSCAYICHSFLLYIVWRNQGGNAIALWIIQEGEPPSRSGAKGSRRRVVVSHPRKGWGGLEMTSPFKCLHVHLGWMYDISYASQRSGPSFFHPKPSWTSVYGNQLTYHLPSEAMPQF